MPAAWEQLTTLLFGAAGSQPVLNGSSGGPAVAATLPTSATEGRKQGSLQGLAWEKLTADLFQAAANERDLNGNPTSPLLNL